MGGYLFDTRVHVLACDNLPEKWIRHWKEATVGRKKLFFFEPLIAEIFYQLMKEKGETAAFERIMWLKGLSNTHIIHLDDNIALEAGRTYLKLKKYSLSLVDSFILVIAKKEQAELITTDFGLRNAARVQGVKVSFLPEEAL